MRPGGEADVEVEQLLLELPHPVVGGRDRGHRGGRRRRVLERLEGELRPHPEAAVRPEVRQDLHLRQPLVLVAVVAGGGDRVPRRGRHGRRRGGQRGNLLSAESLKSR